MRVTCKKLQRKRFFNLNLYSSLGPEMKILHEFVPTRKFLKLAEEVKDWVDGWNVTDSAAGIPAPSGHSSKLCA